VLGEIYPYVTTRISQ